MNVLDLYKTCNACPSQWEGQLENGHYIYIRYRWGSFRVGIGETLSDAIDNMYFQISIGGPFDGVMSSEDMLCKLEQIGLNVEKIRRRGGL